MGIIRRSIESRPPDPYYGSPPSSRRRTTRTPIEEPSGCRVEVGNTPLTGSSSSTIPPSGRATILLGDDLTAVEAEHEMPLILGDPESEDIFATDTERNIMEPTPAETEQQARIALTQYRPRRSSNREPIRPEHIIPDPTNAPPTIDLEAMVATAVSSRMSVTGTTSVPAQEAQPAVTSPSPAIVSHSESSATVQSVVNTSKFRIPHYSRPSTTTLVVESTRANEPFLSRDRRRQEENRHRFRTVQRSEHRQYDRQHQCSAHG